MTPCLEAMRYDLTLVRTLSECGQHRCLLLQVRELGLLDGRGSLPTSTLFRTQAISITFIHNLYCILVTPHPCPTPETLSLHLSVSSEAHCPQNVTRGVGVVVHTCKPST